MTCGVQNLVKLLDKHGINNEKYFLGAAKNRMNQRARKLLAISALSSLPLDCFVISMMEDDRFLLHAEECHRDIVEETSYVASLPAGVWDCIADLAQCDDYGGPELKADVLESMATGHAYLDRNAYESLKSGPLMYT